VMVGLLKLALRIPPPPPAAVLPAKVQLVIVGLLERLTTPPPMIAALPTKVQLVMVGLLRKFSIPPPGAPVTFPLRMVWSRGREAAVSPWWKKKPRPSCWQSRMHFAGSSLAERTVIALPPKSRSCSG